ncbi:MAG: tripartite tricarboxylate transporter substrate binding protein [Rhodopseudomonas sp.]|nr:tripartite tricarboxylate transporter substrate binding protein [Rhodopseudomonas sp.]
MHQKGERRVSFIRPKRIFTLLAAGLLLATQAGMAQAAYPERAVTLIVPFAPGGPTDIIARILAESLGRSLHGTFIVENHPGAAGNIGMGLAARAKPDGYTLLLTSTAIAVNPALYKKLPYDPFKDFAPISELVDSPNIIVVSAKSPINSIADLVKAAKAPGAKFNYSSPGIGTKSNLTGEELKQRAGIEMAHIPYRGAGPAAAAALEGTVQVASVALPAAEAMVKSGQLKALAVTGPQRWFSMPNVPTMIESGYPGFVSETFSALFAPAGTPQDIIDLLAKHCADAFKDERALKMAHASGFVVVSGTPAELKAHMEKEIPAVKALVARAGLKQQ